ncbi:GNAT family N-acetyltransferase [Actinophytocola sp.]|uniref:GNAT family N-acetyltransferase n=1 Tax=Actinophytocola sp. TaxID=1872138 RepID=UPI002D7EB824|nr:amino acid permease [Actinophytocola sp.]HET9143449.1 amino acid permease [Actinophytocola sp.]
MRQNLEDHVVARPGPTASKVSALLAANRLGVPGVLFFIVAAAAPLTTVAGGITAGYAVTGVTGLPVAYLAVMVILAVFAAGYLAMSRHITNAGAFYTYVVHGFGRTPGVAAGFVALLAYNAIQIGLYGIFGTALAALLGVLFAVTVPWWLCALAGWAAIAVVGVLRVDLNGRLLAVLMVAETIVILLYDLVFVSNPAGDAAGLGTLAPDAAAREGWGAALAVALAGFVGFEGGAAFAEETRDARRTVARATFLAIAFLGLLYALSAWALSVTTGPAGVVDAARRAGAGLTFNLSAAQLGTAAADLGRVLFVTGVFAALLSFHNTVARYLFSLGRERVLPAPLGGTHYRTGSPYAGSLAQSGLALGVLVIVVLARADPVATLFLAGTTLGALGVLILMIALSFAAVGYFRRRPDVESVWHRRLAPVLAGVLLLGLLVLVLADFHRVLGVGRDDPRGWVLPALYAVVAVGGLLWGWYLKVARPQVYRTVGLGANRVIGRTMSEWDSAQGMDLNLPKPPIVMVGDLPTVVDMPPVGRSPVRSDTGIVRLHNTTAELDTATTVLAKAFQTDGPGEWLVPEPEVRAAVYPAYLQILVRHALRGAGEVFATADRTAVAIWYPAPYGVPNVAPAEYDAQLAAATGSYLPRFLALDAARQAGHPVDRAHHYLNFVAVLPEHQGRGLGSALLASRLSELHHAGTPAYLEATNRRNLALYLHHGFKVIGTVTVPDGGPTLYRMWREARAR